MPTQEDYDKLKAELGHWKAEHLKRQQGEDAALQKVQDQAAAHEKHVADLVGKHQEEKATDRASWIATAIEERNKLTNAHAAEIARLKAEYVLPIVKAEQERRRKEQAAADQAQIDALTK